MKHAHLMLINKILNAYMILTAIPSQIYAEMKDMNINSNGIKVVIIQNVKKKIGLKDNANN